jgi:23S rRNA (pseudouridine1915-N3)-methyltransferase
MPFTVAVVGRPRDPGMAAAIRDYESRANRYWGITFREVKVVRADRPAEVVRHEGERLLAALPAGARLVACDERGREMSSAQFAEWLKRERDLSVHLAFVVGGAFGLSDEVRSKATRLLALSRFTLSHDLARLLLAEQIYRAGTIARGEPYHK